MVGVELSSLRSEMRGPLSLLGDFVGVPITTGPSPSICTIACSTGGEIGERHRGCTSGVACRGALVGDRKRVPLVGVLVFGEALLLAMLLLRVTTPV